MNDETTDCCQNLSFFDEGDNLIHLLHQCFLLELDPQQHGPDDQPLYHAYLPLNLIISKYQYQPQLMDTHLNRIITPIMDFIRAHHFTNPRSIRPNIYEFLVNIANARGYKYIVKFFSHEVSDLEGLLHTLSVISPSDPDMWHVRYILLLWISFVTLLPFKINRLSYQDQLVGIVQRLLDTGKSFLNHAGKERDAAAILIGRLVSRVDVAPMELANLLKWASDIMEHKPTTFLATSTLQTLCAVLKYTDRLLLLPQAISLVLFQTQFIDLPIIKRNNLLRKLFVKFATRVGLTLLPNRIPSWRYNRGSRSLEQNILRKGKTASVPVPVHATDESIDSKVPDTIESILDIMLNGLRDKDTIVRWSAAKGLGRITFRLVNQALAIDVVHAVIDLFNENVTITPTGRLDIAGVSEHTWHGACLAIAELSRRGLLVPDLIATTLTWVSMALTFDHRRGAHSIGSYVRDSACYVCWSFARAYSPDLMATHVLQLAPMLVTTALYDREVHVRRAASAAFQENVGRQGIFPHGIEIVTATDFFIVGNRALAFVDAAKNVAQFKEYHPYCVEYLMAYSVFHWDIHVRRIAAQGLGVLVQLQTDMFCPLFDRLIIHATSSDLPTRHGAMLALAEIMDVSQSLIDEEIQSRVHAELGELTDLQLHGYGSEVTREAALKLGEVVSKSPALIPQLTETILKLVETSLERKESILHEYSARTSTLIFHHLPNHGKSELDRWIGYTKATRDVKDIQARRGYALALGSLDALPKELIIKVISGLVQNVYKDAFTKSKQGYDAETKRNATQSLGQLLNRYRSFLIENDSAGEGRVAVQQVIDALMRGLDDYTTNTHGDVGSLVRIESIKWLVCAVEQGTDIESSKMQVVVKKLLQFTLSRMDRIRELACVSLKQILTQRRIHKDIHEPARLVQLMEDIESLEDQYVETNVMFTKMMELLDMDVYRDSVLVGVLVCMGSGGGTDIVGKQVGSIFMDYIERQQAENEEVVSKVCTSIVEILKANRRKDRVIVPTIHSLDILYTNQLLLEVEDAFHVQVFELVKEEIESSAGNVNKVLGGLQMIGGLVGVCSRTREACVGYLISQLGHEYPRVRKCGIEVLMDNVDVFSKVAGSNGREIEEMLMSIEWTMDKHHMDRCQAQLSALFFGG